MNRFVGKDKHKFEYTNKKRKKIIRNALCFSFPRNSVQHGEI